jgi:hypothetical protein
MNGLLEILSIATGILASGQGLGAFTPEVVQDSAKQADALLRIAKKAISAHEELTGEPLDLTKLRELPHVD